ncbi:hypothetical protein EG343_13505 [Chryseobacterium nakagawai]|uniref:Uncharacterized protein n=2 Tax=Chryseobacterium nakagawai TaxID=1241982 RepID=A0AAD0YKP3_CHRNA|nr:hypothetical protein EG343_13505 [Chryseobacterium nakagawai]
MKVHFPKNLEALRNFNSVLPEIKISQEEEKQFQTKKIFKEMIQFIMMLLLAFTNNTNTSHNNDNQKSNIITLSVKEDPEAETGDGNGHGNGGNTGGNTGQLPPPGM